MNLKVAITAAAIIFENGDLKKFQTVWVPVHGVPYRGRFIGMTEQGNCLVETQMDSGKVDISAWPPNQVTVNCILQPKQQ